MSEILSCTFYNVRLAEVTIIDACDSVAGPNVLASEWDREGHTEARRGGRGAAAIPPPATQPAAGRLQTCLTFR